MKILVYISIILVVLMALYMITYWVFQIQIRRDDLTYISDFQNIGPGTPYSRLIEIMGEPLNRETVQSRKRSFWRNFKL